MEDVLSPSPASRSSLYQSLGILGRSINHSIGCGYFLVAWELNIALPRQPAVKLWGVESLAADRPARNLEFDMSIIGRTLYFPSVAICWKVSGELVLAQWLAEFLFESVARKLVAVTIEKLKVHPKRTARSCMAVSVRCPSEPKIQGATMHWQHSPISASSAVA